MSDKKKEDYQIEETVQDDCKQEELKQVSFEEQLDKAVGQSVEQFYKDILKQADIKIKAQEKQLKNIQSQQVEFRDEIAIRCFVPLIPLISDSDNYRQAASSAYRAADDFLRVREGAEVE
jgi:hypothetical protein